MKYTQEQIRKAMLLYAVTDQSWLKEGETLLDVVKEVLKNGATFLQIREKDLSEADFEVEANKLQDICKEYQVPYVVNDKVEIAIKIGADGVHVGQSDIKGRDLRAMIGEGKILGISAGTVEEAIAAEKAGADYIGVGAVFGTSTKKNARNMTMDRLKEIVEAVNIPVVAIGGINSQNISELSGSKVDGVAVVSAIFAAENPGEATKDLLAKAKKLVEENE